MAVRIVLFLVGIGFAGCGSYLGWRDRGHAASIFPPDAGASPWLLITGLALLCIGVVLVAAAVTPRPKRAARLAAEAALREETLSRADTFYAERARAADRDWRSGDVAAPAAAVVSPDHAPEAAAEAPAPVAPKVAPPASQPTPVEPQPVSGPASNDAIRAAMADGRLDEADRLLNEERERLMSLGAPGQAGLAELTSIAGDHAAASGRPGHAKWLWRLALKRFGEIGELSGPAASAVSERLRRIDQ